MIGTEGKRVGLIHRGLWIGATVVLTAAVAAPVATGPVVRMASACEPATVVTTAVADAWIGVGSSSNKGSDGILTVAGDPSGNHARALVRFPQPSTPPDGCAMESARLRLFTASGTDGARVEALRVGAAWSENRVVWTNQPATTGEPAVAWSTDGYLQWDVTVQVRDGAEHGFLLRDAAEADPEGGVSHGFHAREKGEDPPQLVIRYAAPPTGEPPPAPAPPEPAALRCGAVVTSSVLLTADLTGCRGDALVIGAPRIVVDLGGRTVDGVGEGTGVRNDGFTGVTVTNGTVQDFDRGVVLLSGTADNVVERLTLRGNEFAAVELFDARSGNTVAGNTVDGNGGGIALVSGTAGAAVRDNVLTGNSGPGLLLRDATGNRAERNRTSGGGDIGIGLERSDDNVLVGNESTGNSDGGIDVVDGSDRNRVEGSVVTASGDNGILVSESRGNVLLGNTAREQSDSGIALDVADDGVVRGNDVRDNPGGIQVDGSSGNVIESNDASGSGGIGIEVGPGSFGNRIAGNIADGNAATGIQIGEEAPAGRGNLLEGNQVARNRGDGIAVSKGGHTLTANVAVGNGGWGIDAAGGNVDGSGNVGSGNGQAAQCRGVSCRVDTAPPETAVDDGPDAVTRDTSATLVFSGTDDTTPAAVLRFACRLDGEESAAFTPCRSPLEITGLAPGAHTVEVVASDASGNTDPTPASYAWTVEAVPDTEPDPTEPGPTEPDPTEPGPTEPDPTEPDTAEPDTTITEAPPATGTAEVGVQHGGVFAAGVGDTA